MPPHEAKTYAIRIYDLNGEQEDQNSVAWKRCEKRGGFLVFGQWGECVSVGKTGGGKMVVVSWTWRGWRWRCDRYPSRLPRYLDVK